MASSNITFSIQQNGATVYSFDAGNGNTPAADSGMTGNYRLTWQADQTSYVLNHTPNPAIADAESDGLHTQTLTCSQDYVNFIFQDADAGWSFAINNNNKDHIFHLAINNDYGLHTVGVEFPDFGNVLLDWFIFWSSAVHGYGFDLAVEHDISFHLAISSDDSFIELDYFHGQGAITLYGTAQIAILTPQEGLWTDINSWDSPVELMHEGMFHSLQEFDEQFPLILAADPAH
jgi:hypothetical protein